MADFVDGRQGKLKADELFLLPLRETTAENPGIAACTLSVTLPLPDEYELGCSLGKTGKKIPGLLNCGCS